MDIELYRKNLEKDEKISSEDGIKSRISRIQNIEAIFGVDVDKAVKDDGIMLNALTIIKNSKVPRPDNYSNALRKYYLYENGKEFPRT
ncbi:hypothetical protein SAMN02745136_00470 [Anaerocolumna jejuensis DSM 15929]|uniref:Uncharacterized protein n=1 Tax=Anaerocolumna jejuensis DSM 15929 TaxID=1121322 RepID=A0A1M6KIT9_9FIRM|nr:hypothetical protein [Anaerocolumna jejuensis]SHJ58882.1 hypothetical protein SAMN02745136_00470 [Anaerocolumna jejuensis DSM 15929]